ncbi:werner helicase interacting protein, putative [Perkinsus marinus ATCC 50983]|uniref:Werner helicase interacting protein, putative n=1 Tax=Perkinsus marinus (strain ATCC 50983 / TXsc) TaxID=423536 RepID=C5LAW6_PERM5|nr:werner helicase interacting protein, putative [Perkinsus marinus ATCC 50983]EER06135.1 werner helicase interacting protein, putative [Perkinsus marinus ATCC 50983]|eukprot:XP_002774319.1 werner helicase interacting protein, putative [Perkinsus marinus ATCC 50983]
MIFWGPPGCGKTTLAQLLCRSLTHSGLPWRHTKLSAVNAGVNDLRRALKSYYPQVAVDESTGDLLRILAEFGMGDVRASLNALELACDLAMMGPRCGEAALFGLRREHIEEAMATSSSGRHRLLGYDKNGDIHYDLASALQKSIRGSDKDAAAYWTTRMLLGGEPPEYVSRRLMRIASEDVGLADPQALQLAAAAHTVTMATGMPECSTALLEVALYLCDAPKSNAVYVAYKNASKAIEKAMTDSEVPLHLRNAPTGLMKELGYGREYIYTNEPRPTQPGELAPEQTWVDASIFPFQRLLSDIFQLACREAIYFQKNSMTGVVTGQMCLLRSDYDIDVLCFLVMTVSVPLKIYAFDYEGMNASASR